MPFSTKYGSIFFCIPAQQGFFIISTVLFLMNLLELCYWIIYAYEDQGKLQPTTTVGQQNGLLSCWGMQKGSYYFRAFVETFLGAFVGFVALLGVLDRCHSKLGYLVAFMFFIPVFRGFLLVWDATYLAVCKQYTFNAVDLTLLWYFPDLPISNAKKDSLRSWPKYPITQTDTYSGKSIFPIYILYIIQTVIIVAITIYIGRTASSFLTHFHPSGGDVGLGEFIGIQADTTSQEDKEKDAPYVINKGEMPSFKILENHPLLKKVDSRDTYCVKISGDLVVAAEGKFGG